MLYAQIIQSLEVAGAASAYRADANEPDPRYKSYGVRMPAVKKIFSQHRKAIRALAQDEQISLAKQLILSKYGEQQTLALFILEPFADYFSPDRITELDVLVRCLHGWSKVDAFAGSLLRTVLLNHPTALMALVQKWNKDEDRWLRRMSVVLFTRKVAASRNYTDFALQMCQNLIFDDEELVLKGVGWALKDLMRADKQRLLNYVHQLRREGVSSVVTLYAVRDLKGQARKDFFAQDAQR